MDEENKEESSDFNEDNNEKETKVYKQKKGKTYEHVAQKHIRRRKKTTLNGWAIAALVFMALFVVQLVWAPFPTSDLAGIQGRVITPPGNQSEENPSGKNEDALSMDLYVMSQCPYGTMAEDELVKAMEDMGQYIDYNIEFIGSIAANGSLSSMHGESEVEGDLIQICAKEYYPDTYLEFITCMNQDYQNIPDNWENCAKEQEYDVETLRECYEGEEGKELLKESFQKAAEAGATGSPTYIVEGSSSVGAKQKNDLLRLICNNLDEGSKPEECESIPECTSNSDCTAKPNMAGICENPGTEEAKCVYKEPSTVNMIVLGDERCGPECNTESLVSQLDGLILDANITEYDYSSEEGKALYEETDLQYLPAVLFDDTINSSQAFQNLKPYLVEAGDYYSLRIGAEFDPTKEICDNEKDDTGDGLVDCEDPDCEGNYLCMEKRDTPKVELFVMSHCPYGTMAEKGMLPVAELLQDKIDFEVKFVNYAMHGEKELKEQMVQYCIQKEQEDKYLSYLRCFLGTESGSEQESIECREEVGIDEDALNTCLEETEEEYGIMEAFEDKSTWRNGAYPIFPIHDEECEEYGITGSPGLAINDVRIPSFGRSEQAFLDLVCNAFKEEPEECNKELDNTTPSPGFGWEGSASASAASGSC